MADDKKTEAPTVITKKEPVYGIKREKSYPPRTLSLKGSAMDSVRREWKKAKHALCCEEKCYYPLTPIRHDANDHEPVVVNLEGKGKFIEGRCSWDPLHGATDAKVVKDNSHRDGVSRVQLIPVPDKKEVEG